jgi:hypothetical protein
MLDSPAYHIRAHYHPVSAAKGRGIDIGVFVCGKIPDIMAIQRPKLFFQTPPGQRMTKRPWKHFRKKGKQMRCPNL